MTLDRWIKLNGLSPGDVADAIGVTRMALWRYREQTRVPRPAIMRRIVDLTQGAVRPEDFYHTEEDTETVEQFLNRRGLDV